MQSNLKLRMAAISVAPLLLWMLATCLEVVHRDPDAFETPLAYLAVTWVVYLPVFAGAGFLLIAVAHFCHFRSTPSVLVGAVAGGGLAVLCLGIASATYRLPMQVWPLCLVVGAAMGGALVRSESPRLSVREGPVSR